MRAAKFENFIPKTYLKSKQRLLLDLLQLESDNNNNKVDIKAGTFIFIVVKIWRFAAGPNSITIFTPSKRLLNVPLHLCKN